MPTMLERLLGTTTEATPRPWPENINIVPEVAALVQRLGEVQGERNHMEEERRECLQRINEFDLRSAQLAQRDKQADAIIAGQPVAESELVSIRARLAQLTTALPLHDAAIVKLQNAVAKARQAALLKYADAMKEQLLAPLYAQAAHEATVLRETLMGIEDAWNELQGGGWALHNVARRIHFAHTSRDEACPDDFQRFVKEVRQAGYVEAE